MGGGQLRRCGKRTLLVPMRRMTAYDRSMRWVPYSFGTIVACLIVIAVLVDQGIPLVGGLLVALPFGAAYLVLRARSKARFERETQDAP